MKRWMLSLSAAGLLLSGCAVYDGGPVYPSGYYVPPSTQGYVYPTYAPPPVYGGVWFQSEQRSRYGGYRGRHDGFRRDWHDGYGRNGYGRRGHWR